MDLADDHFRLLVETIRDYAIYALDPTGIVRSWNAGAQELKGYTSAEIVGRNFAQFFSPEDRAAGKPQQLLATALRAGRHEDVGWRIRKDGSQFWASAIITTLRDREGRHIGFAKVTRDLTNLSYRVFVEAMHAIVWTVDAAGIPNADSPSWREFTGQSEAEWRGLRGWDPVHPDDVAALRVAWPKAKDDGTPFEAEFRMRRHDGEYVWMGSRAHPLRDDNGQIREWFGVTFDISDRKRAEADRERALELWTTTLRSVGDAVISTDAEGRIRFMNPVAERLTGWTADEAARRSLHDVFRIFNEETGASIESPVDKVLRDGAVVGLSNHTALRKRDGAAVPIDDSAAPIRDRDGAIEGVVLVFRDASAEKLEGYRRAFLAKATEEMVAAVDYNDALARVAALAVPRLADWVSIDVAESGSLVTRQLAVAHVDPAKIELARELGRRYPPDPNATTGVPKVMRTGQSEFYPEIPSALLEAAAVDDDHRCIIRELDLRSALVVPLRGKDHVFGAITFVLAGGERRYGDRDLALAEELAHRVAVLIERRRLEEEAEHANRMKDEFLATMSHELRTPLQAIVGYASMLERGIARDPAKAIATILRNATAQTRLVEDILDVARIASGKLRLAMSRVDLAAAVRAALEAVRPAAAARRIRIVEDIAPDLGAVYGDLDRLQQIVWNLLTNAVKFTEPDGVVEVHAARTGSAFRVTVRDHGKGIPPEHLGRIFERFRQLDSSTTRARGGLGLGLAIVRYLVEAHGGTVHAHSDGPGTGATFTVALPAQVDALVKAEPASSVRAGHEPGPLRGIRILIVDDEADAREVVGDVLADAGAVVKRASSAVEAFAYLQAEPPHVLISDIGMPFEDGYSLIRRIRALPPEHGRDVPAIALTAYARIEDARAAEDAGFQLHVVKPVRPDLIVESVRSIAPAARRG